jgi:hypothetical protein
MLLFHGIKVPDEFDNQIDYSFYCVVRRNKIQHSCGDLACKEKYACSSLSNQNI